MENPHKNENFKDSEVEFGICVILVKGEKESGGLVF